MIIIINNSKKINILDKNQLEKFNKSINPTSVLCASCPFKDKCKKPKAIFYGHYPHKVLELYLVGQIPIVKKKIIYIQRIIGKGCGKTSSVIPNNHIPFHQFLLDDAKNILRDYMGEKTSQPSFFDLSASVEEKLKINTKIDRFINSINKAITNNLNLYPVNLMQIIQSPT